MQDLKTRQKIAHNRPLRELSQTFEQNGNKYTQIAFNGERYIYQVDAQDNTLYYEVFERKINRSFNLVSYPTDNNFGNWAKCVTNLERAKKLFDFGW